MHLRDWVRQQVPSRGALTRLQEVTGLAYSTIHAAFRGEPVRLYETARKISEATHGQVSVAELCESVVSVSEVPEAKAS